VTVHRPTPPAAGRPSLRRRGVSLVLLGLAAAGLWGGLAGGTPRNAARPAPTLLVLGAAQYNGRPSPAFQRRLDHALGLYRAGGVRRILISGGVGDGDRYSEGAVGLRYLARQGVPESRLRAETRSRNTLENLEYSRPLLTGPVTLVTDEAHAPRALALAAGRGLQATVSSVPLGQLSLRYRLRERLALLAYRVLGLARS
jgi:uncharacterized SAM-binding protein YcdF (DUF218 family)